MSTPVPGAPLSRDGGVLAPSSLGRTLLATPDAAIPQSPLQAQETGPDAGKPAPAPPRTDRAYIMGDDAPESANRFYEMATRYFRNRLHITTIAPARTREQTLGALLDDLARVPADKPLGKVYVVSHAHESGSLGFALDSRDTDRSFDDVELADALAGSPPRLLPLDRRKPSGAVDDQTQILIRGCDVGRATVFLQRLRTAFGNPGLLAAPKHRQGYFTEGGVVIEGMARSYSLAWPEGAGPPSPTEVAAMLHTRFPGIPKQQFATWLDRARKKQSGYDILQVTESAEHSFDYGDVKAVPKKAKDRTDAIHIEFDKYPGTAERRARSGIGDPNRADQDDSTNPLPLKFDDHKWKITVSGAILTGIGHRVVYSLNVAIRDAAGAIVQHALTDHTAYGVVKQEERR